MENLLSLFVNIFLITAIINCLWELKKPSVVLSCGIFGFSGRPGRRVDAQKLLVLGLYNRTRGTDSFGYYYNGNITKGVDKIADFKDFIVNNKFIPGDLPFETVMAHTRKSTYGANTLPNAHPHRVENYVQTHNGTIKNIWELCRHNGIPIQPINVDSDGLAHIIQKNGRFNVLEEYVGAAALTMLWMDDPESLYLYHGASREKEGGDLWEERPLFTLQAAEGLYYSSMEESLLVINRSKTVKPVKLPHNKVWLVQNGQIVRNVFTVHRTEVNIPKAYEVKTNYPKVKKAVELPFVETNEEKPEARSLVFKESKPLEFSTQDVYYMYGRHFTNITKVSKHNSYENFQVLLNGVYRIDRDGKILEDNKETERNYDILYFIHGMRMRDKASYETALIKYGSLLDSNGANIAYLMSKYTMYPVINFLTEGFNVADSLRNKWYLGERPYTGTITPRFTNRKYRIKNGKLKNIHSAWDSEELWSTTDIQLKLIDIDNPNNGLCIKDNDIPEINEGAFSSDTEIADKLAFLDIVTDSINNWSDKIIKKEDVTKIPEEVLIFMGHYLEYSCTEATEVAEEDKNDLITIVLHDLINTKQTFLEYLKSFGDQDFINNRTITECFKNYSNEQLLEMSDANRYKVKDFDKELEKLDRPIEELRPAPASCELPTYNVVEETEEDAFGHSVTSDQYSKLEAGLQSKIDDLTEYADEFRAINTDKANQRAEDLMRQVEIFAKQLQDLRNKK